MLPLVRAFCFMKWEVAMINNTLIEDDSQIIAMLKSKDAKAKDLIYEKYGYIIDLIMKKYARSIRIFNIDKEELRCEALVGFSNGINHYLDSKEASLATFLTICVTRKVYQYIDKSNNSKTRFLKEALSLDYEPENGKSISEMYPASSASEPLNNLTSLETIEDILKIVKDNLSSFEYEVFTHMVGGLSYIDIAKKLEKTPKQIDNTIYRIKSKLKKVLNSEE